MQMKHPCLVEFIGAGTLLDKSNDPSGITVPFLVQEFCTGGSLNSRIWDTPRNSCSWYERLIWASDTAEGMDFIHSKGYAHRDLKSQNILYSKVTASPEPDPKAEV